MFARPSLATARASLTSCLSALVFNGRCSCWRESWRWTRTKLYVEVDGGRAELIQRHSRATKRPGRPSASRLATA